MNHTHSKAEGPLAPTGVSSAVGVVSEDTARLSSAVSQSGLIRVIAIALIAIGFGRMFTQISFVNFQNDFSHYYLGGMIYASGKSPYTEHLLPYCEEFGVPYDEIIPYAAHPPLIQWTFGQLSNFEMPTAFAIWFVIQMIFLVTCVELARRIIGTAWSNAVWLILLAIFINSTALQSLIHYAQVQMLIGLCAYGALLAHLKGRSPLACGLITFASAFKIYPVVLAPWFLFVGVRQWTDLIPRLLAMACVSAVCILVPGYQTWIDFATLGVSTLSDNAITWTNYSVQSLVAYLMNQSAALAPYSRSAGSVASVLLITSAYAITCKNQLQPREAFCVLLVAATIGGFIAWTHYMTLMFLPVCILVSHAIRNSDPVYRIAAGLAAMMVLIPQFDETFLEYQYTLGRIALHFYPLVGIAMMVVLLVRASTNTNAGLGRQV